MLNINVLKMKNHCEELSKQIDNYEENTMSICQELYNSQTNWHDDNSEKFFDKIPPQKNNIQNFIENLRDVNKNYKKIIEETNKVDVGMTINTISVNQDKKPNIISDYDTTINSLKNTMNKLNSYNLSFCSSNEKTLIKNEVKRLNNILTKLNESKTKTSNLFDTLKNVEQNVANILINNKINFNILEEDYTEFLHKGDYNE